MKNEFNIWKIRREFPMLSQTMHGKPFLYFDTAATAQKPQCVIQAMSDCFAKQYATVHRSVYDFASHATSQYQRVRESVRAFLNARLSEEIIFTKGTTEGINLVAHSFGQAFLSPGDEILISEMEHHSNIVPWQLLAQRTGAHLRFIPIDDRAELDLNAFHALLSNKTKIVSIAHIANATGTINPIEEIIQAAHTKGAKVLIDGAQSAAHLPVDVQKLGADFYVFSGHKIYGPTGIGVLYGKKQLLEQMPPYQGGGDMVEAVTMEGATYQDLPLKFEAGTPPIAEVMGLGEAIHFIESIGRAQIAAWEGDLLVYATRRLQEIDGLKIIGTAAKKGSIISFIIEGLHPLDIATLLDIRGIAIRTGNLCAQPTLKHFQLSSLARISFGIYNTPDEIDHLTTALKEVVLLLCPSLSY
jgi:cysteine desulfurase/selenocysteine lyase